MLQNRNNANIRVNLSGFDKLMPDVDENRVYESRLVHQLDSNKVVYCTRTEQLYFWEPQDGPLRKVIRNALMSLKLSCKDQAVQMDNLGVFNQPRKLFLTGRAFQVVVTALRLSGVSVQFTQAHESRLESHL